MPEARHHSEGEPLVLRLSPGPSPRLRWGERIPLKATANGGVLLDLSEVRFAEPTLALRLAASEAVHAAEGAPFEIVPPRDTKVRNYLGRAGLAKHMGLAEQPHAKDVLMPITRIADSSEVEPTAERLAGAAAKLPGALAPTNHALVLALGELCDNACSHGENDHGTFVLAQRFGSSRLVLAVGDLGVGIPVHLGEALQTRQDVAQAKLIARALKRGVSGANGHGEVDSNGEVRGNGLPKILETLRGLGMPAAEFGVWSGVGRVGVRMRPQPQTRRRVDDVNSRTVGTWIEVVLSSTLAGRG
jgi:hypothetical protein